MTVAREATEMFAARGFAVVRMEDIAAAVGVTARALYRHYPSKHALLFSVATASQDPYLAALDGVDPCAEPRAAFRAVVADLARVTLDGRSHALMWQREARHLDDDERAVVRGRIALIAQRMGRLIANYRGVDATDDTVELLAWAVLSVLTSPGHHNRSLPRPETDRLLTEIAESLAHCDPVAAESHAGPTAFREIPRLSSRRERILQEAARLFSERGYANVTIEDIGGQVGILGPSLYHHFASKQEILATLVNRVNEWITLGVLTAKGSASNPAAAVAASSRFYVSFSLRFPDLVGMTLTETVHLAEPEAETLRRARNDVIAECAMLLQESRPELSAHQSVLLTETVIALSDDLARTPHLHTAPIGRQIAALAATVLATPSGPPN